MITGGSTMYSFLEGRSINGVTKTYPPRKDYYSKIVEVFGISGWDDIVENNLNVTGEKEGDFGFQKDGKRWGGCSKVVEATTDEAKKWDGWGTALKPAHEPMVLARKPIEGTIAENVLKWGVGGINIDACRVEAQGENFDNLKDRTDMTGKLTIHHEGGNLEALDKLKRLGRFPANLMHDGSQEVLDLFPESNGGHWSYKQAKDGGLYEHGLKDLEDGGSDKQGGSAARFFYCPKANKKDRNEGCEDLQEKENKFGNQKNGDDIGNGSVNDKFTTAPNKNSHPTVKPTELMRYLCRLITPQNGTVLDPFNGSGSTGKGAILEGFNYVGIELDAEYIKISEARIKAVL
jgi:site-specific DNA-methyltransferase (adenine-specific)